MISPTICFKHRQKSILCKKYPASSVFLLCLSTVAIADKAPPLGNDTIPLTSMTVYDDRTDPELIDPPRMRNRLDRDALQVAEMPDLNSVLKNQSGLTLNQGTGQIPTKISLRGASGGQGLITLDGVPLFGNFAGYYSLSHYALDALEQVTVTRGPGGERHGSRTLGGAIHLQTRHMQQKDSFLRIEGGSYDTVRGAVGTGLTTKAGDFSAVVGRSDIFNGISQAQNGIERDDFGMTHASANWAKEFSRGALDASVYFVRTDEDTDGPGFLPNGRIGWVDDKLARFSDETWVAQLRGQYTLASYWNSSLQFGFTQDRQKGVATLIKPSSITSQLYLLDWKNTHRLPLSTDNQDQALLVWGINTQQQQVVGLPSAQTVVSPNARGELSLGAWQWSADARSDHGDTYGNHPVFTLGLNRSLPQHMSVWANGGTGYRQPGVNELKNPVYGNPTLQGEHSAGGEIGWRWQPMPESEVKVSGYYQNYRQMIVMQWNPETGISKAGNVPEADVWGAEMQSKHRWTSAWESGLNYSYMLAINPLTQLRIQERPEHQGVFWNEVQLLQPLKLRIELTARSGYWFDSGNTLRAKSAPRINILLKYQLTPKTEVYLRGENITDERTPEILDFSYNGASFYLGLRTGF